MTPTHYTLLNVTADATATELKVAYRRLMRAHHPDVAGAAGESQTKLINNAYSELSDPAKRRSYDFSIRPAAAADPGPTYTAPADPGPDYAAPSRPRESRAAQEPAAPMYESDADIDYGESVHYSPIFHRRWRVTWGVLFSSLVTAQVLMGVEWGDPSVTQNGWRLIAGLAACVAIFAYFTREPDRWKTAVFLWLVSASWPLALLGWAPVQSIGEGLAPTVLVSLTALAPLTYLARWSWQRMRLQGQAKRALKKAGWL